MLAQIGQEMPPLRGIFHLAGVLDDGILREQSRERFDRVMAAKVHGAWNLHELTRRSPLELFVLFSSAAAMLGSPGQGNYASANAFLDALAHHRRALKLPALSVNWGSWDEVGMAARLKESEGQRWSAAGIGWIGVDQGLATLERLILEDRVQAAVLPIDWPKFFERIPAGSEPAWLTEMARTARSAATGRGKRSAGALGETAGRHARRAIGTDRGQPAAAGRAGVGHGRRPFARSAADLERVGIRLAHGRGILQSSEPLDRPAAQSYRAVRLSHAGKPCRLRAAGNAGLGAGGRISRPTNPWTGAARKPPRCWTTSKPCRKRKWTPW